MFKAFGFSSTLQQLVINLFIDVGLMEQLLIGLSGFKQEHGGYELSEKHQ